MKQTDEVKAALEIIRAACEDDFERRRVEIFAKELTNGARILTIDETRQEFNGVIFKAGKNGRYQAHFDMHKFVWCAFFGEPPKGYEIHHKDLNPANNDISNLQCLTHKEHREVHNRLREKEYTCDFCGKKIIKCGAHETKLHFCDDICKGKWRHYTGKTNIERTCAICGKKFITKKRGIMTAKTCSAHCRNLLRWEREREKRKSTENQMPTSDTTGTENQRVGMGG